SNTFDFNTGASGDFNTAIGAGALSRNTTGSDNTATGVGTLGSNTTGSANAAYGENALSSNTTGNFNTANGLNALLSNITGSNNIDIGAAGVAGESDTIRIGHPAVQKAAFMQGISGATVASGVTVIVGSNGHLGTIVSSERFKDEIKPMDQASEAILALKPV